MNERETCPTCGEDHQDCFWSQFRIVLVSRDVYEKTVTDADTEIRKLLRSKRDLEG